MTFPNFSRHEVACQHCGRAEMDEDTCGDYRICAKPMASRCVLHLAIAVLTTRLKLARPTGAHASGRAVDIAVSRGDAYALMRLAMRMGFTGVGVQQKGDGRFIHLDDLTAKEGWPRPTVWSY